MVRRLVATLAAAGMALAPVAANAGAADALSLSRAAAPMSGFSWLQAADDDDDDGSTAVILGVVLVVLIGIAAVSGSSSEPSNSP